MKAVPFKNQNRVFGENQPQYIPLPVNESKDGYRVISCWKMTFKDRLRALFTGRVYVASLTYRSPLQPLNVDTSFKELEKVGYPTS